MGDFPLTMDRGKEGERRRKVLLYLRCSYWSPGGENVLSFTSFFLLVASLALERCPVFYMRLPLWKTSTLALWSPQGLDN